MLYESTSRKVSAPAVNSVIFMAQRPNKAIMLIVRAKFMRILSDSVGAKFTGILSDSVKC